jgi:hypothetical protein
LLSEDASSADAKKGPCHICVWGFLVYCKLEINVKLKITEAEIVKIFALKILALSTQKIQFNKIGYSKHN